MIELAVPAATRPDVVMGFLSFFITAIAAWAAGGRARVVFNQQTPVTEFLDDPDFAWKRPWRRRVFALMTRWFYGRADAVVVTSAGVGDDLATRYGVPRSAATCGPRHHRRCRGAC
jgi:hypothetical protein